MATISSLACLQCMTGMPLYPKKSTVRVFSRGPCPVCPSTHHGMVTVVTFDGFLHSTHWVSMIPNKTTKQRCASRAPQRSNHETEHRHRRLPGLPPQRLVRVHRQERHQSSEEVDRPPW